jgi:hypothetical protein
MILPPRLEANEIEYFTQFMGNKKPGTKMVEWGSGGSTLMFLPHFETGMLVSVEHNREWYDKVNDAVEKSSISPEALANFIYCWRPPTYNSQHVDLRFYGYGVPFEENPCFASDYINPESSGIEIFDADVYFVDGICRGAILATIAAKAKKRLRSYNEPEGYWEEPATVFIHDYYGTERRESWYNWASSLYKRVERIGDTLARLHL